MTHPTGWPTAQSICDIPEVRAALDAFAQDAHEENMLAMVSAIMGHANDIAASANEEQSALVDKLQEALAFWLPSMPMRMGMEEMASRIEHDSWLLVGASGELSPGAEEAGWIVKVEPDASPASVRAAALEEERIDWIANANCPGGVAYPFNVKCAIRHAIAEVNTALSAAPAGGPVDPIIATWPAEIWLNVGDEPLAPFDEHSETTWCSTPQGEHDVRYVRAPIAAAQGEGK